MTDHDTTTAKPERTWVWWCNEESIAAGKFSVLAIVETVAAVGVWWWLAMHFNWSIFSFIALFAAPVLLLRSEESIADGVKILSRYWNQEGNTKKELWLTTFITVLSTYLATRWLANHWLSTFTDWDLLWRTAMLGALAFAFAYAVMTSVAVWSTRASGSGVFVIALYDLGLTVMLSGLVGGMTMAIAMRIAIAIGGWTSIAPVFAFGIVLRSQFIRLFATLRHPIHGVARLPRNWRETLWITDLKNPPELIPQARSVSYLLAVRSLWLAFLQEETISKKLFLAILILIFYLSALAFRWSLKASAWLWFPLILLLKPPFCGLNSVAKNRQIGRTIFGLWRKLPLLSILIFAWLMLSLFPDFDFLRNILPEKMGDFVKGVGEKMHPPPAGGIRYIALWLFCALTFFYWLGINNYEADEKSGEKLPTEAEKIQSQQDLAQLARSIERLRMALIATVIVGGYAFVAVFLHDKNPTYAEHFLAPWLLRIL
jgi:hypothetical protein